MSEVDLERLARAYGHRRYDSVAQRIAPVLAEADLGRGDLVADVGGGRGSHGAAIQEATGARVIVVDPSAAMARQARSAGVATVIGRGEALPLASGACGLVLFHLSIHHGEWERMVAEAWRITRAGGVVWVWTMSPEYVRQSHLARWFPRAGEIDAARFPPPVDIEALLGSLGGTPRVAHDRVVVRRPAGDWTAAVEDGFVSTLHLLDDDEIAAGLERFRAAHPDPDETITYALEFIAVWSRRPSVES